MKVLNLVFWNIYSCHVQLAGFWELYVLIVYLVNTHLVQWIYLLQTLSHLNLEKKVLYWFFLFHGYYYPSFLKNQIEMFLTAIICSSLDSFFFKGKARESFSLNAYNYTICKKWFLNRKNWGLLNLENGRKSRWGQDSNYILSSRPKPVLTKIGTWFWIGNSVF